MSDSTLREAQESPVVLSIDDIEQAFDEVFPGHELHQESIDFARAVEQRVQAKLYPCAAKLPDLPIPDTPPDTLLADALELAELVWRGGQKEMRQGLAFNIIPKLRKALAADDAARGTIQTCTYPDCHCPFDAPSDPAWCAKGLPQASRAAAPQPNYAKELGECQAGYQTLEREVAALKAAAPQSVEPVAEAHPVAWIRKHPDGTYSNDILFEWTIEQVRRDSGAWVPLIPAPPAKTKENGA